MASFITVILILSGLAAMVTAFPADKETMLELILEKLAAKSQSEDYVKKNYIRVMRWVYRCKSSLLRWLFCFLQWMVIP